MANRYPLILNDASQYKFQELPEGDNLDLYHSSIVNAEDIGSYSFTAGNPGLTDYFNADANYSVGTIMAIGGVNQVTVANGLTSSIVGIVTDSYAYAMDASVNQTFTTPITISGKCKWRVTGTITKGDTLVSTAGGIAVSGPYTGAVVGYALENYTDIGEGLINVYVSNVLCRYLVCLPMFVKQF